MSQYDELGFFEFWRRYNDVIVNADKNIIMPVLRARRDGIGAKWHQDANYYYVTTRGGVVLRLMFDISTAGQVELEVLRREAGNGSVSAKMKIESVKDVNPQFLQERFKRLLSFVEY